MKQKIFVLYTGGTIGMTQSSAGLRPDTALVDKALAPFSDGLDFEWHVCQPLIDSSAVTLQNQRDWLELIIAKLPDYDGILVLHGTDTMAYTANLFALSLQGLDKPVILTGSQWPYDAANSDAPRNLATAVSAFSLKLKQVAIAFDGKLFPAVGSSKVSTETAAGFDNLHFAPSNDAFVRAVQAFTQQGKLLLNISQVPQGCAAAVYAQGNALRQAGIINGGKCNLETATALMTLAVSHDWDADKVQQELRQLNLL